MKDTLLAHPEVIIHAVDTMPTWYVILKDALLLVFAGIGSYVALRGLSTWRKQIKGNTEYELARRYLHSVNQVRDGLKELRADVYFTEQIVRALREKKVSEDEILTKVGTVEGEAAVYDSKMTTVNTALDELRLAASEAEVLWGNEAVSVLNPLFKCIGKVWVNIRKYIRRKDSDTWYKLPEDERDATESIISLQDDTGTDAFSEEINDAVEKARQFIMPHMKM